MTLLNSPLFRFILIFISCALSTAATMRWIIMVIPFLYVALFFRRLVFEVLVLQHSIENSLGLWQWYDRVDDDIYLGAVPLESMSHRSVLALDLKVEAVLSILEDFEFGCDTLAGCPVQPDAWKRDDISHLHLKSPDFYPPPFDVLERGADWINTHVSVGKKVYCHCKSGKGRSASVIIAYFMKYKRQSAISAYEELRSRRVVIFGPKSSQYKNMLAYEQYRKERSKSSY